jgi:hypothetical protein
MFKLTWIYYNNANRVHAFKFVSSIEEALQKSIVSGREDCHHVSNNDTLYPFSYDCGEIIFKDGHLEQTGGEEEDEDEEITHILPLDIEEQLASQPRQWCDVEYDDPLSQCDDMSDFVAYFASKETIQQKLDAGKDKIVILACPANDGCHSAICFLEPTDGRHTDCTNGECEREGVFSSHKNYCYRQPYGDRADTKPAKLIPVVE